MLFAAKFSKLQIWYTGLKTFSDTLVPGYDGQKEKEQNQKNLFLL